MTMDRDTIATIAAIILVFIPWISFFRIFNAQYCSLKHETVALQILITRSALFPTLYATIMFISFLIPESYDALQIVIAFAEGYSLLCFFALIVQVCNCQRVKVV